MTTYCPIPQNVTKESCDKARQNHTLAATAYRAACNAYHKYAKESYDRKKVLNLRIERQNEIMIKVGSRHPNFHLAQLNLEVAKDEVRELIAGQQRLWDVAQRELRELGNAWDMFQAVRAEYARLQQKKTISKCTP
jgi:uncharacterized protein YPO0396